MTTPEFKNALEERLPAVRGRITPNARLGHMTWFGVGGPAEVLFKPKDEQDLIDFITECPKDIPITTIGVASNIIIRDGGIPGVVIRLGREFAEIKIDGDLVTAGASALDMNVSLTALKNNVMGLEFLSGIPGTIGGALRMNAGAYGTDTKDRLVEAEVLFYDGTVKKMTPDEMGMTYRHNNLPNEVIFLKAVFKGDIGDYTEIEARMDEIKTRRATSQPIKSKTGGSTFANPDPEVLKGTKFTRAWELIDGAGCRAIKVGGAQISEKHANFMINTGNATAADLERLGEEIRDKVYEKSKVMLRWEIKRIGIPLEKDTDIKEWINKKDQ